MVGVYVVDNTGRGVSSAGGDELFAEGAGNSCTRLVVGRFYSTVADVLEVHFYVMIGIEVDRGNKERELQQSGRSQQGPICDKVD
jgi:hypothetical protein